ncbi:TrbC/VirB2 family protein [Wolbachia endosymbiont of Pentidionis agamae]|uniref:TrbC/VirB2 family protein n=1 Tax=Wolbachia endosymbiont of Pentidionis agamae TaxID=3110435 RepID=UPI002FD6C1A6
MKFCKFLFLFLVLSCAFNSYATTTEAVICKAVGYIQSIGGQLMTVVIIGSSILAIFGRMAWPALVALVIFCGVFFGASTVVKSMTGKGGCAECSNDQESWQGECKDKCKAPTPNRNSTTGNCQA